MELDIKNKIHDIRDEQVILDYDLAELYNVETKSINQAVKRNIERFPQRFMFQLTKEEYNSLNLQFIKLNSEKNLRSQNVTSRLHGGRRYLPFAFTEQGVAMLSSVLRSKVAIKVSIQIMDAFVKMRRILASNNQIITRISNIEKKNIEYDYKFEKVFKAIENKNQEQREGIFYEGQVFDAFSFVSDIIRKANSSIILIDNYIDDTVLTLLNKRKNNVNVYILTNHINKQLSLDIKRYNAQYHPIKIIQFKNSHDRFLIIDQKDIYHIGASLKDLGKKWFAFSKIEKDSLSFLEKVKKIIS